MKRAVVLELELDNICISICKVFEFVGSVRYVFLSVYKWRTVCDGADAWAMFYGGCCLLWGIEGDHETL